MKEARAAIIRAKLEKLQAETAQAYADASTALANNYKIGRMTPAMAALASAKNQLENQLFNIWFRQEMVKEPTCKFCGETWDLSQEVDMRYGVTRKQAVRAGCFWCCGWCYAHVLNGTYSNRPEMRPGFHEWTDEEVKSHDEWLASQER